MPSPVSWSSALPSSSVFLARGLRAGFFGFSVASGGRAGCASACGVAAGAAGSVGGLGRGGRLGVGGALGLRRGGLDGRGDLGLGGALVTAALGGRLAASAAGLGGRGRRSGLGGRGLGGRAARRPPGGRGGRGGLGGGAASAGAGAASAGASAAAAAASCGVALGLARGGLLGLLALALLLLAGGALLGLLAGLLLGLLAGALLLGPERLVALRDDVADRLRDDRAGLDRVVVARDHVVDAVRVAVRVDQADDRDPQALGLLDRDDLGLEVDDEHRVGRALHVLDAAEVGLELGQVGLGGHALARRQQRELALGGVALEIVQALDAQRDRLEVGQQAAEPAMVDVGHAGVLRDLLDGVARLLLGAHEQHGAAAVGDLGAELLRLLEQRLRLEQVDDVDAPALAVDEAAHLGVPAARLVSEMHSGLQQLPDADVGHRESPLECGCGRRRAVSGVGGPGVERRAGPPSPSSQVDRPGRRGWKLQPPVYASSIRAPAL